MTAATIPAFSTEAFESFLKARHEPEWLTQLRKSCWETFQRLDWPARNDEEWIRTDIRLFKLNQFSLPQDAAPQPTAAPALLAEGVQLAGHATAVNGRPQSANIEKKWQDKGV